jgi:hypothetical protein
MVRIVRDAKHATSAPIILAILAMLGILAIGRAASETTHLLQYLFPPKKNLAE